LRLRSKSARAIGELAAALLGSRLLLLNAL
jgi:hypothetical protein